MKTISEIVIWIDHNINHTVVDWFFNLFDYNDGNKLGDFVFWVWQHTFREFCCFAVDLYDKHH